MIEYRTQDNLNVGNAILKTFENAHLMDRSPRQIAEDLEPKGFVTEFSNGWVLSVKQVPSKDVRFNCRAFHVESQEALILGEHGENNITIPVDNLGKLMDFVATLQRVESWIVGNAQVANTQERKIVDTRENNNRGNENSKIAYLEMD